MLPSSSSTAGAENPYSSWDFLCSPFYSSLWVRDLPFRASVAFTETNSSPSGFGYDKLTATPAATKVFVFLYCLANFFQNFGPNTTTFIIPGEIFPTRYRSTAHGISAACGKLGAIVAQVGFVKLKDIGGPNKFLKHMCVTFSPSLPVM